MSDAEGLRTLRRTRRPTIPDKSGARQAPAPRARLAAEAHRLAWPGSVALEVGIVGLPNSGKTTLFNALTRAGAEITAYASVTDKPNVGMATIADDRLDRLADARRRAEGHAGRDPRRRRPGHGPAAARQPPPGRRDPRRRSTASRRTRRRPTTSRRSSSSCSSPTATTSSAGSSGSRSRRSRATRKRGRRSRARVAARPPRRGRHARRLPASCRPSSSR